MIGNSLSLCKDYLSKTLKKGDTAVDAGKQLDHSGMT